MLTDNLIGLYHLNNALEDGSGSGNTGTSVGGFSYGAAKLGGASGSFNGTTGYISLANESNFDFEKTSAFSISFWLKTSDTEGAIISKSVADATLKGYEVFISSGIVYFQLNNDNSAINQLSVYSSINTVGDNSWHHVVATSDGSATEAGMKVYADNINVTTLSGSVLTGSILNNNQVEIGRRTDASLYLSGLIDELAIWNRALIAREVGRLYNGGAGVEIVQMDSRRPASHGAYRFKGRFHPALPHIGG